MKYPNLFSPLKIRNCVIPNRIMSTAAVTRLAAEDGHVTPEITERYQRMAQGGLGAMVVEAAVVLPSRSSFNFRVSDDQFVAELHDFTDAVRAANPEVKIGLQIMHFLKLSRSGWRQKVEDLTREEVEIIPEQFASGAARAKAAGFDFVEVHMAHFTTLASFLSLVNKRTDEYGGDFEGRVRLPTKVIAAVREAVGDFPVGMRMNGEEFTKEGNTLEQTVRIARRMAKMGVDYISVSAGERFEDATPPPEGFPPFAGTGYSGCRMSPRWWSPDGVHVYLADTIRKALRKGGFDIPVATAGKIRMPDLAEEIVTGGQADIIGMARTVLCDPDWPNKAREGKDDEIVKCAACGYCSESDEKYETVTCIQWPKGAVNAPSPWLLVPPCRAACPAGLDIRGYMTLVTQGCYEEALNLIESRVPMPGVVGRVCPRFCEPKCNRKHLDGEPLAINAIKRFVADANTRKRRETIAQSLNSDISAGKSAKAASVAVIGSGPAGLSAAFYLARLGYNVTIFEAESVPGGMLALGIPAYRLPREILKDEIDIIKAHGVEIKLNSPIGKDAVSLQSLKIKGYEAIFIAAGAQKNMPLNIQTGDIQGLVDGVSWLKDFNLGKSVKTGRKVAVIGGGNVAIDAARTALHLGAEEVSVVYRRSREEMPAISEEIVEAEKEGVNILYLTIPSKLIGSDDVCEGLECLKTELGEPDESGRRKPITVAGSEFILDTDVVIAAIGQSADLSFLEGTDIGVGQHGTIIAHPHSMATNVKGVFAGGDVVSGPSTVIEAMAAGRKAALAIDAYLSGKELEVMPEPHVIDYEMIDIDMFKKTTRQEMPLLPVDQRLKGFAEVDLGFDELAAMRESDRCFQCGMFPKK